MVNGRVQCAGRRRSARRTGKHRRWPAKSAQLRAAAVVAAVAAVWAAVARVEAARVDVGARHDFQRVENLQLQNPALSRPVISRITGAQALRGAALYGAIRFFPFFRFLDRLPSTRGCCDYAELRINKRPGRSIQIIRAPAAPLSPPRCTREQSAG